MTWIAKMIFRIFKISWDASKQISIFKFSANVLQEGLLKINVPINSFVLYNSQPWLHLPSGITVWTYLNKQYPRRAKRYLGIFSPIYPYIFFQSLGLIHCGPTLRPRFIIFCLKKAWESINFKQLKMF